MRSVSVAPGFRAGISLASEGDMGLLRSAANRVRFLRLLDIDPDHAFGLRQVHSRRLVSVDGRSAAELAGIEADGMIASEASAVLTVTVADCLPIFLVDRRIGAFSLVHSGWRGTGVALNAVCAMVRDCGSRPADLAVTIGPGIGTCCYRVPDDRAADFAREFGVETVTAGSDGQPRLDLRRANVRLLEREGVGTITVMEECTCCSSALGSFRRQGAIAYTLMMAFLGAAVGGL